MPIFDKDEYANYESFTMKISQAFLLLLLLAQPLILNAQETHHEGFSPHRISLLTGYGFISGAIDGSGNEVRKIIPIIGLDYDYWFSHKIALGLWSDLELNSYTISYEDQQYLDRNYAIVASLVVIYEPIHNWALFAGPGYEIEAHHNFPLLKIGTEYGKSFEGGWGMGLALSVDIKEVNTSINVGLVASKRFGKSKH